jgi:hypothetical protein
MTEKLTKDQTKQIASDLLSKSYKRFKQEIKGENEEFLDRLLRQFRSKVARLSWKSSQNWCKWNQDGPVLMPDHTRIYYRKGSTEVLLQEFPPQIRFMKFKGSLAKRNSSIEQIPESDLNKIYHYSLALPYVIFIFKFVDGVFSEVRCAFSDRPLRKLEEKPLRPYFSNIDSNLSVCLGASFDRSELQKDDIAQQSALVLSHFWHSSFSDEWSSHFWASKSHFEMKDQRLANLNKWQDATVENSLFVIEGVEWLKHSEESFGDLIVRLFETDKENHNLHEELYKVLVDEFLQDVVKAFTENIDSVGEKASESMVNQFSDYIFDALK